MTTQPDALPACPHGHKPDTGWFDYFSSHLVPKRFRIWIKGIPCQCDVSGPDEQSARAAWAALCAPHALASSRAEVERLRKALEEIIKAWDHKTGDYYVDNYLSDVEIDAARAALAAQGGGA